MIAIHHTLGTFSDKWIEYCNINSIDYKIVNCYDSEIIDQLDDCEGLMWHWLHDDRKAQLFARQLIYALEEKGIKVFPNSKTCWHYDDKVGQKYLLEAINAPLVPTYVFYDENDALEWANITTYPKIFKTRNGAGAHNVKLINDKKEAFRIIKKAFSKGIPSYDKVSIFKDSIWKLKRDKSLKAFGRVVKYFIKLFLTDQFQPDYSYEKNYVYFQDFIPDCDCDYRLKIADNKCWGRIRYVRDNDFRASGSGKNNWNPNEVPLSLVELAFKIKSQLKLQSVAFDFVIDQDGNHFIIELSYTYGTNLQEFDFGYWNQDLKFHKGKFNPYGWMVERVLNEISFNK